MPSTIHSCKYVQASPFPLNRWGIPVKFCLLGGGENDLSVPVNSQERLVDNNLSRQEWHSPKRLKMSSEQSVNAGRSNVAPTNGDGVPPNAPAVGAMPSVATSSASNGGANNSWAQVAGKGIPAGSGTSDEEKLQSIKEALLSTEGWGGENVNQDSSWDLPPSPEPTKEQIAAKAPVNDGCELWKNAKVGDAAVANTNTNSNVWNQNSAAPDKSHDSTNNWFQYPPASQQWRGHQNENQTNPNMWMGPKNPPNIEDSSHDWAPPPKNPIPTSGGSSHSMPLASQSGSSMMNNSYPLGPFPHMDAQNLAGGPMGSQSGGSAINSGSHKMPSGHGILEQGNGNNAKDNRSSTWDNMVSMPKEAPSSSWGGSAGVGGPGPGAQPMPHKWIGLPNHSIPDRHMVSSSNQGPIMAPPPLPHGLIKPDQIMWSQINPAGDYHHDSMSSGNWPNNFVGGGGGGGPPNFKSAIPEPNNEEYDLSVMDTLKKISQDNTTPHVPAFLTQIQLAVQAGFLSPQILHQPLAPNSLLLLNQLVSSVGFVHKLMQQQSALQPQMHVNKNAHQQMVQINVHISKTKQQIQHFQNQIANQQDLYMKHQSHPPMRNTQLPHNMLAPSNPQNDYKNNIPDHFLMNFNQMNVRDSANPGLPLANDPNKWKQNLPNSYSSNMSRDHSKSHLKSHASSTNQLSYMLGSDSSWPHSKSVDHGWSQNMGGPCHGVPTPPSTGSSMPGSAHDSPWSSNQQPIMPFDLDSKPFEPGKPWRMKNLEESFDFAGAPMANRSSLGMREHGDMGGGGTKSSPPAATLSSLPLNSNTWSFNPTSHSSNANNVKMAAQALRSKETWNDGSRSVAAPLGSELWPPQGGKGTASLPGNVATKQNQSWGAIGRSTSWAGNPSRSSSSSALQQSQQWPPTSSTWLILKNLTPEIDGSTLKTLCMQHGPLVTFHLSLNHGFAFVNYGTQEEAIKAQSSLNNCLLSNTTILAEFAAEAEVNQLLGSGRGTTPTSQPSTSTKGEPWASGSSSLWNPSGNSSLWSGSSYNDTGGDQQRSTPSSLKSYLPDGLLNSEAI